jgi:hypothetical protein
MMLGMPARDMVAASNVINSLHGVPRGGRCHGSLPHSPFFIVVPPFPRKGVHAEASRDTWEGDMPSENNTARPSCCVLLYFSSG